MCQIQKTLTFYITTRTKLGYFKMRPDNLSRSKINFPFLTIKDRRVHKYGLSILIATQCSV